MAEGITLHELSEEDVMSEASENKYGTQPYSATAMPDVGDEPRSSKLTKSLIWPLLLLNVIISVLGTIYVATVDVEEYYAQSIPPEQLEQMTPEMLEAAHPWTIGSVVGFGVLTIILFLIVGLGLRANKTWGRFLGLIFAFIFVVFQGVSLLFMTDYSQLATLELISTVVTWLTILVTIWWIVQAMSKQTGRWFAIHRRLQS